MKSETRHWYRIALAQPSGAAQLVAASGDHAGAAIAEAERALPGAWPVALEQATGDEIPLGESVGKGHVVRIGDAPELPAFRWVPGVLPSLAGAPELAGVRRGFVERPQVGLFVIEALTDAEHLTDLFLGLVERLPAADNLEVRVMPHYEGGDTTDVWLTSRIDAHKIIRFLDDHDVELLGNGHVELSVYVRKHKATLRLTEHKTVVWLGEERALEDDVVRWLGELAMPRLPSLVTVRDAAHFHYRPAKSRDRLKLAQELYRQRLRKVDVIRGHRPAGPRDTAG